MLIISLPIILLIWLLGSSRKHLISASSANLAGVIFFVGLGLQFHNFGAFWEKFAILVSFYFFLVVGERTAMILPIGGNRFGRFGDFLIKNHIMQVTLLGLFTILTLFPAIALLAGGPSVLLRSLETWGTNNTASYNQSVVEYTYNLGNVSTIQAFVNGITAQFDGFWFLGAGIGSTTGFFMLYPLLILQAFMTLLTSGGSRTMFMISFLLPFMIWLLARQHARISRRQMRKSIFLLLVLGLLSIVSLISMDFLLQARKGEISSDDFGQRIERALRSDFAYGGLGLELGATAQPTFESGVNHLVRTIVQPIPRFIWSNKPTSNPNQDMTEWYTGVPYYIYGSIWLFTPLGEALFYMGYVGLFIIPFLYGLTTVFLERIYLQSLAYRGLLAQLYIWSFLSMRLTFFNLFSALVARNWLVLLFIFAGAILVSHKYKRTPASSTLVKSVAQLTDQ
jgi:hypothetical protein